MKDDDVILGVHEYPGLTVICIGGYDLDRQVRGAQLLLSIKLPGETDEEQVPEAEIAATPPPLDERAYSRALRRHKPVTGTPD